MIVSVEKEDDGSVSFRTNGCGCCSVTYPLDCNSSEDERLEIIQQLKRNLEVLEEACDLLNMSVADLINYKL